MPVVRQEAVAALEIDPELAEAEAMLGAVAAHHDYDWKEAERRFRIAMSFDPVPPNARSWYAYYCLVPTGRPDEAVVQARQALTSDPLNIAAHCFYGSCLVGARRLDEAQAEARKVLDIEEKQLFACSILAFSYALQDRWPEALHVAERASPRSPLIDGQLAGILRRIGEGRRADELLRRVMSDEGYGAPLALGWCSAICGDWDRSAEWFQKAAEERHPDAPHHAFLALGSISRWPAVAEAMGLQREDQR